MRRRYRHARAFALTTRRGRRSPAWAWPVRTSAGDVWHLTGLQRAGLLWLTGQAEHGRHRVTVTELGEAIGTGRGTASLILRRLRSLELVGGRHPTRGRVGGFTFWMPGKVSALRDRDRRAARWPSANDSTPTSYGGYLSREGMRRAWRTASGSPPGSARPPGGGSAAASPRARGRPWPPRYTDEPCPHDGHRVRLVLGRYRATSAGDLAAVWSARCPRCRRAIAAALVLAIEPRGSVERIGDVAARIMPAAGSISPGGQVIVRPVDPAPDSYAGAVAARDSRRARIAAELAAAGDLPADMVDELRVAHLGWTRPALAVPPIRPAVSAPSTELDDLTARVYAVAARDLAALEASRRPRPPVDSAP